MRLATQGLYIDGISATAFAKQIKSQSSTSKTSASAKSPTTSRKQVKPTTSTNTATQSIKHSRGEKIRKYSSSRRRTKRPKIKGKPSRGITIRPPEIINDAFLPTPKEEIKPTTKKESMQMEKQARGQKIIKHSKEKSSYEKYKEMYKGYEEYYKGLRETRKRLALPPTAKKEKLKTTIPQTREIVISPKDLQPTPKTTITLEIATPTSEDKKLFEGTPFEYQPGLLTTLGATKTTKIAPGIKQWYEQKQILETEKRKKEALKEGDFWATFGEGAWKYSPWGLVEKIIPTQEKKLREKKLKELEQLAKQAETLKEKAKEIEKKKKELEMEAATLRAPLKIFSPSQIRQASKQAEILSKQAEELRKKAKEIEKAKQKLLKQREQIDTSNIKAVEEYNKRVEELNKRIAELQKEARRLQELEKEMGPELDMLMLYSVQASKTSQKAAELQQKAKELQSEVEDYNAQAQFIKQRAGALQKDIEILSPVEWEDIENKKAYLAGAAVGFLGDIAAGMGVGAATGAAAGSSAAMKIGGTALKAGSKIISPISKIVSKIPIIRTVVPKVAKIGMKGGKALLTTKPGQAVLFGGFEGYNVKRMWEQGMHPVDIMLHVGRDLMLTAGFAKGFQKGFSKTPAMKKIEAQQLEKLKEEIGAKYARHYVPYSKRITPEGGEVYTAIKPVRKGTYPGPSGGRIKTISASQYSEIYSPFKNKMIVKQLQEQIALQKYITPKGEELPYFAMKPSYFSMKSYSIQPTLKGTPKVIGTVDDIAKELAKTPSALRSSTKAPLGTNVLKWEVGTIGYASKDVDDITKVIGRMSTRPGQEIKIIKMPEDELTKLLGKYPESLQPWTRYGPEGPGKTIFREAGTIRVSAAPDMQKGWVFEYLAGPRRDVLTSNILAGKYPTRATQLELYMQTGQKSFRQPYTIRDFSTITDKLKAMVNKIRWALMPKEPTLKFFSRASGANVVKTTTKATGVSDDILKAATKGAKGAGGVSDEIAKIVQKGTGSLDELTGATKGVAKGASKTSGGTAGGATTTSGRQAAILKMKELEEIVQKGTTMQSPAIALLRQAWKTPITITPPSVTIPIVSPITSTTTPIEIPRPDFLEPELIPKIKPSLITIPETYEPTAITEEKLSPIVVPYEETTTTTKQETKPIQEPKTEKDLEDELKFTQTIKPDVDLETKTDTEYIPFITPKPYEVTKQEEDYIPVTIPPKIPKPPEPIQVQEVKPIEITPITPIEPIIPPEIPPITPPIKPIIPPFLPGGLGGGEEAVPFIGEGGLFGYKIGVVPFLANLFEPVSEEEVDKLKELEALEQFYKEYLEWLIAQGFAPEIAEDIAEDTIKELIKRQKNVSEEEKEKLIKELRKRQPKKKKRRAISKTTPLIKQSLKKSPTLRELSLIKTRGSLLR